MASTAPSSSHRHALSTGTPLGAPTDAGHFHAAGYLVVSLVSGPTWLFDWVGNSLLRFNLNTGLLSW